MLIDHTGKMLYPEIIELRYIGRFAFIAFAFILVYNYKFNSSNKKLFLNRLLLWGVISIAPFIYFTESLKLNIFITFLIGLLIAEKIENREYLWLSFLLPLSFIVDYSIFGVAFIVALYFLNYNKTFHFLSLCVLAYTTNYYNFEMGIISIISFLTILFLIKLNKYDLPRLKGIYFYAFYPVHMFILKLIKVFS